MVEDYQEPISQLKENILSVWGKLDVDDINRKIAEKEELSNAPGFWDDNAKATKVMNDIKLLKGRIEPWQKLVADIDDIETMYQMALEENDQALEAELKEMYEAANKDYEHYSILNLLSDEVDKNDCFLSVHAGAGGTEACDWTFMLSRMYQRWAERHGYKIEVVSEEEADAEATKLAEKYQMEKADFLNHFGGLDMIQYDLEMRKTIEKLKELNK